MRPRLLDLFCGAGGCSVGYHRAGFDVVGVDNNPAQLEQYPFPSIRMDAMDALHGGLDLDGFDVIHASPPCQAYVGLARGNHPDLIGPVLDALTGRTWVLENVPTAPLHGVIMCGQAFGLHVRRHRRFASSELILSPGCACGGSTIRAYYGKPGWLAWSSGAAVDNGGTRKLLLRGSVDLAPTDMGIDWMTWDGLREAIPPAYTQHIGEQLLQHLAVGT